MTRCNQASSDLECVRHPYPPRSSSPSHNNLNHRPSTLASDLTLTTTQPRCRRRKPHNRADNHDEIDADDADLPHADHSHPLANTPKHYTHFEPHSHVVVRKTPIFSGVVAPLSILLEIPGLTSKWYVQVDSEGIVIRFVDNPAILTVAIAVSLSAAVFANIAMIFRFLEIVSPRTSLAVAIAGFGLHVLINLVALATFGGIYGLKNDGLSLSASFWMVFVSTITSLHVNASLIIDFIRTKDFLHSGSGLTQRQKLLVLAVMGLLIYLSLGSLVFAFVLHLDFLSALYYSSATILTIGFGDIVPPTALGKILVVLYAPTGIVLVATVVAAARSSILEGFQSSFQKRRQEYLKRVVQRKEARKLEKRTARLLKKEFQRTATVASVGSFNLCVLSHNSEADAKPPFVSGTSGAGGRSPVQGGETHQGRRSNDHHPPLAHSPLTTPPLPAVKYNVEHMQHELERQQKCLEFEFNQFKQQSAHDAQLQARIKISIAFTSFVAFWLLGALAFTFSEKWDYLDALWFCFIAMTTIGYGDYTVKTQLGRGLFVIWGLMGVAVLTILLAVIQDAFGSMFEGLVQNSANRLFNRLENLKVKRTQQPAKTSSPETTKQRKPALVQHGRKQAVKKDQQQQPDTFDELDLTLHEEDGIHEGQPSGEEAKTMKEKGAEGKGFIPGSRSRSQTKNHTQPLDDPTDHIQSLCDNLLSPSSSYIESALSLPPSLVNTLDEKRILATPRKLARSAFHTYQQSVHMIYQNHIAIAKAFREVPELATFVHNRKEQRIRLSKDPLSPLSSSSANQNVQCQHTAQLQSGGGTLLDLYLSIESDFNFHHQEQPQTQQATATSPPLHQLCGSNPSDCILPIVESIQNGKQEHEIAAQMVIAHADFEDSLKQLLDDLKHLETHIHSIQSNVAQAFQQEHPIEIVPNGSLLRRKSF